MISRLNPASGEVGTSVVITGADFGERRGDSSVTFNGRVASTTRWSDTSITATAPAGARTGPVVVTVGQLASNGVAFTVVVPDTPVRLICPSLVSEPSGRAGIVALLNGGDEPGADVAFAITHTGTADEGNDYTVGTVTIEAGESVGEMDPRLEVVDDTVPEGEETIELTITAAGYEEASCTIRLEDDEAAISGLAPAAGPVGTSVAITGTNFGAAKGTSTVTFNGTAAATTAWSDTSITATAPAGARTGNVVVTVGEVATNGVPFTVTGVTVTPTELTIKEGQTGTYTVVLDSRPASAVTVSMFAPAGTDLSVDILPVFTGSNWDEPQTVTVTAGEDEDQQDDTDTIAHRTASADAGYHDLTVDGVEVTVTDNDAGAGVRVTPRELTIEEGEEGTYTVVLNTEPSAGVTVAVTAGGDLTVMPASLTFTTLDWDTAQEVTVTAAQDDDATDETETITHAVTSTDSGYSGLAVDEVRVTIADDEGTGGPGGTEELTVSTTRLRITEGNMGKYTVVLNREPSAGVTVGVSAPSGGDLTVMPATLDFTTSNWDTPQEVRVEAGQDTDLEDEVESITHTITRASSSSSSSLRGALGRQAAFATAMGSPAPTREYVYLGGRLVAIQQGGAVSEASVVVTIDDDDDPDTPGVPALTDSLKLTEGHTGAYTLELGAAPTADVAIALSVSRGSDNVADVSVSPASVTFSSSNWDSPQWITVSVGQDSDTVGETETITHAATSTDSRYQGITIPPVRVVIRDRNRPTDPPTGTLTASPDPCTIAAGATTCSTTLTWTSRNTTAVQLRRIMAATEGMSSTNEIVVRSGSPNGHTEFSRIETTESVFYLYDYSDGWRGEELASESVHGVKQLTLSPTEGDRGTGVTLTGSHFGAERGDSIVNWKTHVPSTRLYAAFVKTDEYRSWSDTQIVAVVPEGAGTGVVKVDVGGYEHVAYFTVTNIPEPPPTPVVSSLSPASGPVGTWVTVSGEDFGSTRGTTTATWQDYCVDIHRARPPIAVAVTASEYRNWSDSSFEARVPSGVPTGTFSVVVTADNQTSNCGGSAESFTVTAPPPLDPTSGSVGTEVTIRGSVFGGSRGMGPNASTVTFNGTPVTSYTSWSATRIVVEVPVGATTGPVKVTVGEVETNLGRFEVTTDPRPTITRLNPDLGSVNTPVTISGSDFGASQGTGVNASRVTFNGTRVSSYTSWRATSISVKVPSGATTGPVVVTVNSIGSNTDKTFTMDPDDPDPDDRPSCTLSASYSHLKPTESTTLSWTSSNATRLVLNPGEIDVTGDADRSRSVRPDTVGEHTYRLTASRSGAEDGRCETVVRVWAQPTIRNCSTSPVHVRTGGSSDLDWTVSNAETVTVDGTVVPTDGPHRVTLSQAGAETYTVKAGNPGWTGGDAAACRIGVTAWDRPTASIEADRTTINEGQPFTLSWSSSNADSASINQGIGSVTPNVSGSRELRPTEDTYPYTITASNPAWTGDDAATDSVTVTVDAKPPGTISASPNPCTIAVSATTCTTTLRWSGSGTTGLLVRVSHNGAASTVVSSSGRTGSTSPSWIQRSPTHSYVFYLYDYEARVQGAQLDSVTVRGVKAPVISQLSRTQGNPDTQVTIYGSYFGDIQGSVSFSGSSAEIDSWSDTSIRVLVPVHLYPGTVQVTVTANSLESNEVDFTVTGTPPFRDEECDEEDEEECPEDEEGDGDGDGGAGDNGDDSGSDP